MTADEDPMPESPEGESSAATIVAQAREKQGLSPENVATQTRIPIAYIRMIEAEDYALLADRLYLLPYIRRYGAFLGLDGEDLARRFVNAAQRAELSVVRISEPFAVSRRRHGGRRWVILAVVLGALVIAAATILWERFDPVIRGTSSPGSPPAAGDAPDPPG